MADYRLHSITWKNVIDYSWLRLDYDYPKSAHELAYIPVINKIISINKCWDGVNSLN